MTNAIKKIKRAKFFFKDMSLIKFDKYEPKTIPNTEIKVIDVRKNQSILTCVMSDKKPKRVSESSRTTSDVYKVVCAPSVNPILVGGLIKTLNPTPPTSMTSLSCESERIVPLSVEIIYPRSFLRRDFSTSTA